MLEHLHIPLTCERARIGTLRLSYVLQEGLQVVLQEDLIILIIILPLWVFPRVVFRGVFTDLAGLP